MQLLIVTGMSGAGKSLALRRLEDLGYYCVDNLPSSLLDGFLTLCTQAAPPIARAAISIDSRESALGGNWERALKSVSRQDVSIRIVFLDCRDAVLSRRYSETRRRHPLSSKGDVPEAILRERALLQGLRDAAHSVIDTSDLKPLDLYRMLEEVLGIDPLKHMTLLFMSFGFKRGVPIDADMVFDMRFLPNPFYEPGLRPLSGLDAPVREFVFRQAGCMPFFDETEALLSRMLPGFAAQGRSRVMVAFGCTGGRHRSVAAAEEMASRFSKSGVYNVRCFHRDFHREAADLSERFELQKPEAPGQSQPQRED